MPRPYPRKSSAPYDCNVPGGYFSNHHRAISSRRANHTPGWLFAYRRNRSNALDRAGRPAIRQCSPTDIIFGCVRPSSYSTSNVSFRYS